MNDEAVEILAKDLFYRCRGTTGWTGCHEQKKMLLRTEARNLLYKISPMICDRDEAKP